MASNNSEVLDPAASLQELEETASRRAVNRRHFMATLGVAGAATGAAVLAARQTKRPDTVEAAGFSQTDVLNFALNLEFLEATFYSYVTQGTDLPPALITASGAITNPPAKISFTGSSAQITDVLNEIYFDELNHVTTLRSLLGSAAISRPALNLGAYATVTAANVLSIARMLEDVGTTAYAGAASSLSGANLTYAAQILAVEGFHSGALRLINIQNQALAPYYPTTGSSTASGSTTFSGTNTSGSTTISAVYFTSILPVVGQIVSGPATLPGTKITAVSGANTSFTGNTTSGSTTVSTLSAATNLAAGQLVTGAGIPAGTTIVSVSASALTLTLSAAATATATKVALVAGSGTVTMSAAATATVANGSFSTGSDALDVATYDPGSATTSAGGPAVSSGEYYGFFNTVGSANANQTTPIGTAFARTTSQVLTVVYGAGGVGALPGAASGGFFPSGMNGLIKTI